MRRGIEGLQTAEVRKHKKRDSPLGPLEHLCFHPVKPILDF